jgi:predicted TIM-barrel fold metal-dependent hydrolase
MMKGKIKIPRKRVTRRLFLKSTGLILGTSVIAGTGMISAAIYDARGNTVSQKSKQKSGKIIDSHCHLKHGDKEKTEYTPEVIVEIMDKVGIDKSIVFAMSTTTKDSIVRAEMAVKKFPDRLIPYVYAIPNYERSALKEIEDVLYNGLFRGIKIHKGECTLAEYVTDPVLKVAGKYKVPCLIDLSGDLETAIRIARTFPETSLIVAHMGKYLSKDEKLLDGFITLAENFPNVFLDISGVIVPGKVVEAVERIGSLRIFWGIDGPHPLPENTEHAQYVPDLIANARAEIDRITQLNLNDEDKSNILGGSISRFFGTDLT